MKTHHVAAVLAAIFAAFGPAAALAGTKNAGWDIISNTGTMTNTNMTMNTNMNMNPSSKGGKIWHHEPFIVLSFGNPYYPEFSAGNFNVYEIELLKHRRLELSSQLQQLLRWGNMNNPEVVSLELAIARIDEKLQRLTHS